MNFSWQSTHNLNLNQDIQIITPNQRLSKFLHLKFQNRHSINQLAYEADKILSIEQYLIKQFHLLQLRFPEDHAALRILSPHQEFRLWQEIVENSSISESLLFKTQGLNQIINANQLCVLWNVDLDKEKQNHHHSIDQEAFESWKIEFDEHCSKNNFITKAHLYSLLSKAFEKDLVNIPERFYFYGFDEINPAQESLIQVLKNKSAVTEIQIPDTSCELKKSIGLENFEDEIITAALWAKNINNLFPQKSIAIVIPKLTENRSLIENNLTKILNPEKLNIFHENPRAYNLSSGIPLSDMPLAKSALNLLRFIAALSKDEKVNYENLLSLTNDNFLFSQKIELIDRIKLSEHIRKKGFSRMSQNYFWKMLFDIHGKNENIDFFLNSFKSLKRQLGQEILKKNQTYSQWGAIFLKLLDNFGWLQQQSLNSENYQCCQKIKSSLLEFYLLDECHPTKVSMSDAVAQLARICQQIIFQAESINEENIKINVLGVLEAAAQDFDYIWICQMNDHIWPSPSRPNPFLSSSLQKTLEMPHSSAEKELRFSNKMLERFSHHCQNLIFSFANYENDTKLNPSNLIKNIDSIKKNELFSIFCESNNDSMSEIEKIIKKDFKIDYFQDEQLVPIESLKTKGGNGIIKSQANCAFQAFSRYRLGIQKLEPPKDGLNAIDKGNILHYFMELFWKEINSQQELNALSQGELDVLIDGIALKTTEKFETLRQQTPKAFELEIKQSKQIIRNFIVVEKSRNPFEVIAREEKKNILINELELTLRADRVDKLEDGSLLIIDYKSGNPSINDWIPPRMAEPQLPLYLYNDDSVKALSYGILSLNPSESGFQGLALSPGIANGIETCDGENKKKNTFFSNNWDDITTLWKNDIEEQANNFSMGYNRVNPKKKSSCTYCDLSGMCRIGEIESQDDGQ